MNSVSVAMPAQNPTAAANTRYQDELQQRCQQYGYAVQYQIMTDRRGGRTAWSATAIVQGEKINARFWYDGQYVNNAKEDAAQVALIRLGFADNRAPNGGS